MDARYISMRILLMLKSLPLNLQRWIFWSWNQMAMWLSSLFQSSSRPNMMARNLSLLWQRAFNTLAFCLVDVCWYVIILLLHVKVHILRNPNFYPSFVLISLSKKYRSSFYSFYLFDYLELSFLLFIRSWILTLIEALICYFFLWVFELLFSQRLESPHLYSAWHYLLEIYLILTDTFFKT